MALKNIGKLQGHCGINLKFFFKSLDFIVKFKLNSIKIEGNRLKYALFYEFFYSFLF